MKKPKIENNKASKNTTDESIDLFSLVFHKTVFLHEQTRDREAIRSWLHSPEPDD